MRRRRWDKTFGTATSNVFIAEQLTASNAFPGYAYDWNIAPGSFVYAGTATASGTVLFDTGLTNMILEGHIASGRNDGTERNGDHHQRDPFVSELQFCER